jgi:MFS family permease
MRNRCCGHLHFFSNSQVRQTTNPDLLSYCRLCWNNMGRCRTFLSLSHRCQSCPGAWHCNVRVSLGIAMFESVMYSVVGDLYFVHQRGSRMALYTTSNSGLSNLPAMLAGKIAQDLGWRWVFWLLSIFLGVAWMLVILWGWETAFRRNAIYNTDISSQNVSQENPIT